MEARLKEIAERHGEVEHLMSQPETASDPNAIRKLGREYSQLQHVVELWNQMTSAQTNLEGVQDMIAEEDKILLYKLYLKNYQTEGMCRIVFGYTL